MSFEYTTVNTSQGTFLFREFTCGGYVGETITDIDAFELVTGKMRVPSLLPISYEVLRHKYRQMKEDNRATRILMWRMVRSLSPEEIRERSESSTAQALARCR